jgi:hypothetical protein
MPNAPKIFENAIDSIELGIADYQLIPDDKRRVISSVRNIFAGILLLFKSKLAELSKSDDEALLKQNILPKLDGTNIKWVGDGKKTANFQQIQERFENLDIKVDWTALNKIQQYRNNIEHYFDVHDTKITVVSQYITKSFIVICSFIRDYLDVDPKECFSQETWNVFIDEQTVYEGELEEVRKSLSTLEWLNPKFLNIFQGLLCPECASFLIAPTEVHKAAEVCEFRCRSCSSAWTYDELIDIICDSIRGRLPGEPDEPMVYCPECYEKTYNTELQLCLKCEVQGPFICSRCEDVVPSSELMSYEETKMCGYCAYMYEKLRDE